ncbi:MAG TPA: hypothetical protein VJN67_05270 [Stellaceae bacterium]|nr:hypothetical protein [Stellaceae bacterium]
MKVAALLGLLISVAVAVPAATATEAWQEFSLPGTDVAVSTPGKPTVTEDGVDRDGVRAKTAQLKIGEVQYSVTHTVYPRGYVARGTAVIDLLNRARDSLAAEVSGRVADERRFAIGDVQASEFVITVPPSTAEPKAQSAKVRLYVRVEGATVVVDQCVALGPSRWDRDPDARRFLESVRFPHN